MARPPSLFIYPLSLHPLFSSLSREMDTIVPSLLPPPLPRPSFSSVSFLFRVSRVYVRVHVCVIRPDRTAPLSTSIQINRALNLTHAVSRTIKGIINFTFVARHTSRLCEGSTAHDIVNTYFSIRRL